MTRSQRRKLLSPIKQHPRLWTGLISVTLYWVASSKALSYVIAQITEQITNGDMQTFRHMVIRLIVRAIARFIMDIISVRFRRKTQKETQKDIYLTYLKRILSLTPSTVTNIGTGRLNSVFQRWCNQRSRLSSIATDFLDIMWSIILSLILIGRQAWWQRSLILFVCFLCGYVCYKITHHYRLKPLRQESKELITQRDHHIMITIMSYIPINANDKRWHEKNIMLDRANKWIKTIIRIVWREIPALDISYIIMRWVIIAYTWVTWQAIINGNADLGQFVFVFFMFRQNMGTISRFMWVINRFNEDIIHITKLRETIDDAPKLHNLNTWAPFTLTHKNIELTNVIFSYGDNEPILTDVSLSITPQTTTALVWPSGGGKSTIIKLIAAHLQPQQWSIIVDDVDLAEVNLRQYRSHIWYLTQEPIVFDGTILANIGYGVTDPDTITESAMKTAITNAHADFIRDLPDWLETQIGEKGIKLSGGQRQRLALVTLFLKDPEIIILDEPTSALDSVSEDHISQALQTLCQDKTVIVIAHRLQTVKHADRILYIEDGQIVEEGTHNELITRGQKYAQMVELQMGF